MAASAPPARDEPKQKLRMQRLAMGAAASMLMLALTGLLYWAGYLALEPFAASVAGVLLLIALFYGLFRSGLNLRAGDPSLTLPMMVSAATTVALVMHYAGPGRKVIALAYVLIFAFGVFRLSMRAMLWLALYSLALYLLVIAAASNMGEPRLEYAFALSFAAVLAWLAWLGGYYSRLRHSLSESNRRLEQAVKTIEELAVRDELTRVYNRRHLMQALAQEQARLDRGGPAMSVGILDVDHFKRVNDGYGHAAGDEVLKAVAAAGTAGLRLTDVFGRYGGEEFMLILTQSEPSGAVMLAERLRERIAALRFPAIAENFSVTASIGLAQARPGEAVDAAVARADAALYRAKNAGRNRVESG